MGYDMWLTTGISDNYYSHFAETYVSYNHGWAFYKYLNKERGIRWIYNKPMSFVVDGMNNVLDELVVLEVTFETVFDVCEGRRACSFWGSFAVT